MKKKYHELRTEQKDKAQDMMHPGIPWLRIPSCGPWKISSHQVGEWIDPRKMNVLIRQVLKAEFFPWVFHCHDCWKQKHDRSIQGSRFRRMPTWSCSQREGPGCFCFPYSNVVLLCVSCTLYLLDGLIWTYKKIHTCISCYRVHVEVSLCLAAVIILLLMVMGAGAHAIVVVPMASEKCLRLLGKCQKPSCEIWSYNLRSCF